MNEYRFLSIDAWAEAEGGWTWNAWYDAGRVPCEYANLPARALLRALRTDGYLSAASAGRVAVEDDGYNVVIVERSTNRPLFAIEYGAAE